MKIYLAGGMHTGWQDRLIERYPKITFIDPRTHGLTDPKEFTEWDIKGVEEADLVFAYLEKTNPSGLGTAFEVGYAVAIKRFVIFVNEKQDKYAALMACSANKYFETLNEALAFFDRVYTLQFCGEIEE